MESFSIEFGRYFCALCSCAVLVEGEIVINPRRIGKEGERWARKLGLVRVWGCGGSVS